MGKLVVFEGIDGSGKSRQIEMMRGRLGCEKRDFMQITFPRYEKPSSSLIKMYLGGEFGKDPALINPYAASSFFAVDRYASFVQDWRDYYTGGGFILTDRYTTSNALHQGAKLPPDARERFFAWLYEYEFCLLGLPKPDVVIYLDIDAETAMLRIKRRREETGAPGDIHEEDAGYLRECTRSGVHAAAYYGWRAVDCCRDGGQRTPEDIHEEIYRLI